MSVINQNTCYRKYLIQVVTFGAFLIFVVPGVSQTRLSNNDGCQLIDNTKMPIYIRFDSLKVDKAASKDSQMVWLRLHNNLTCGITIPAATLVETIMSEELNAPIFRGDIPVSLFYRIQDYEQSKAPKTVPESAYSDVVHRPILVGGKSLLFSVPLRYFQKKNNVVVTFGYLWEGQGNQTLKHQVFFLYDMLPERVLKSSSDPSLRSPSYHPPSSSRL